MHHSDELEQVVGSLFDRLVELGLSLDGALIFLFDKEKRSIQLWIATTHLSAPVRIDLPYDEKMKDNTIIKDLWNAIENGSPPWGHGRKSKNAQWGSDRLCNATAEHDLSVKRVLRRPAGTITWR